MGKYWTKEDYLKMVQMKKQKKLLSELDRKIFIKEHGRSAASVLTEPAHALNGGKVRMPEFFQSTSYFKGTGFGLLRF
jgi:hypothetical protein